MDYGAYAQNLAQLLSLLWCMAYHATRGALGATLSLLHPATWTGERHPGADFYVGRVHHSRKHPVRRAFAYPLRSAVVDLDAPPAWFVRSGQAADHMSADQIRERCGADGAVRLLTSPWTFGYVQNPISVYYCYEKPVPGRNPGTNPGTSGAASSSASPRDADASPRGRLAACVAEVTNTPWGERVVFNFDPKGQRVPKSLHVSPFMDMLGDWDISASSPGDDLSLVVSVVAHPVFGDYFHASYRAKIDAPRARHARNERAGVGRLWRFACTPHRVAFWIYAQAAAVLWRGVPFYPPPGLASARERGEARGEALKRERGGGCPLRSTWREAPAWPWKT